MKEYIKKFSTLASANNYEVKDIPFTATAVGSGNTPVNVVVNQSGATLSVSGNEIDALFVTVLTLTIHEHDGHDDEEIQYEEGMTWAQWIGSSYNREVYNGQVTNYPLLSDQSGKVGRGMAEVHDDNGWVSTSDTIDSTKYYSWVD